MELVITAVGADRPGLVEEFARHVNESGANLGASRMMNLGGQFALIAQVLGPAEVLDEVQKALQRAAQSLKLSFEFAPASAGAPSQGVPFRLRTYSMDQPGIVRRVTAHLLEHGINIEELETRFESAPFMGTPLFTMNLLMRVPTGVAVGALRRSLQKLGDSINCDIDLDSA